MQRVITAAEVAAYQAFAAENRIVVEGEVGEKNANVLAVYLDTQMNGATVNKENLTKAFQAVRSQLVLVDPREAEYTKIFNLFSQGEQTVFANWWSTQSKRLITTGLEGAENAAIILGWMKARRYQISSFESLDQAVQNIISQPGRKLTLVQAPSVEFTPGRHSGKKFEGKAEEQSREYVGGRVNWAQKPHVVEKSFSPKTVEAEYQRKCDELRGHTHSLTAQCQRLLVTKSDGTPDYKATYAARVKFLESRNGERF